MSNGYWKNRIIFLAICAIILIITFVFEDLWIARATRTIIEALLEAITKGNMYR